jgi:hypothetical protein
MSTQSAQSERTDEEWSESTLGLDAEIPIVDVPATLSDEQQDVVQMAEIRRRTVRPGHMTLNVVSVETAANSPRWAITVEHPVEGEHTFYLDKPVRGWSRDYMIVRLLDWYDIVSDDVHMLQLHDIHVSHDPEQTDHPHGWHPIEPPDYTVPIRTRCRRWWDRWIGGIRPKRTVVRMYSLLLLGVIGGSIGSGLAGPTAAPVAILIGVTSFVASTVIGLAWLSP